MRRDPHWLAVMSPTLSCSDLTHGLTSYLSVLLRTALWSAHVRGSPAAPKRQKERNSCSRQNKSKASNLFHRFSLPPSLPAHMQAAERETPTDRPTDGQDERIIPKQEMIPPPPLPLSRRVRVTVLSSSPLFRRRHRVASQPPETGGPDRTPGTASPPRFSHYLLDA